MLITIHSLPPNMRYSDIKALLKEKCGLTEIILDNLISEGSTKKVTVGVGDDGDAAILVRKINGLFLNGYQLYVEDVRKKKEADQPFRLSSSYQPQHHQLEPVPEQQPSTEQLMQRQWMMQQMMSQAMMATMYASQTCQEEPQQPIMGHGSQNTVKGYYTQPQLYNSANNAQVVNQDNQSYEQGNGGYDRSNENIDRSKQNYDRSNQNYDRSNQSLDRSNQSYDRGNQSLDRCNQSYDRGNQSLDRSNQSYDRCNQSLDRSNQSYDRGNQSLDRSNQSYDRGYQSLDRGIRGFDGGNQSLDRGRPGFSGGNQSQDRGKQGFSGENQNLDRGNQNFDRGNRGFDGGNQSLDRGKPGFSCGNQNVGRGNQNFDRGNRSFDGGNQNLDRGRSGSSGENQSLDRGKQGFQNPDRGNQSFDRGSQNYADRPVIDRYSNQRSSPQNYGSRWDVPTKRKRSPSPQGYPNKIRVVPRSSGERFGPDSSGNAPNVPPNYGAFGNKQLNDSNNPYNKPGFARPSDYPGARQSAPKFPDPTRNARNMGQNASHMEQNSSNYGHTFQGHKEVQKFGPNGPKGQNAPNLRSNAPTHGGYSGYKPPFVQNAPPRPSAPSARAPRPNILVSVTNELAPTPSAPFAVKNEFAPRPNAPFAVKKEVAPRQKTPFAVKKEFAPRQQAPFAVRQAPPPKKLAPRTELPKPKYKYRPANLLKVKSNRIPTAEEKQKYFTWIGQATASILSDFRKVWKDFFTNEEATIIKKMLRPKLTEIAENNPPTSVECLLDWYRYWFPQHKDLFYLKLLMNKIRSGKYRSFLPPSKVVESVETVEEAEPTLQNLLDETVPSDPEEDPEYALPVRKSLPVDTPVKKVEGKDNTVLEVPELQVPTDKMPRYPNADKNVYKSMKRLRAQELETDGLYALPPAVEAALGEECDAIRNLMKAECAEPAEESEKLLCDYLINSGIPEFDRIVRLEATKRILQVHTSLALRVTFDSKPPRKPVLTAFLKTLGIVAAKPSDLKKNMFWIAHCKDYEAFDRISTMGSVNFEGTRIKFHPLSLVPKPIEKPAKKPKKVKVDKPEVPWISLLRTGKQIEKSATVVIDNFDFTENDVEEIFNVKTDNKTSNHDNGQTTSNKEDIPTTSNQETDQTTSNQKDVQTTPNQENVQTTSNQEDVQTTSNQGNVQTTSNQKDVPLQENITNIPNHDDGDNSMASKNIDDFLLVDEYTNDDEDNSFTANSLNDNNCVEMIDDDLEDIEL